MRAAVIARPHAATLTDAPLPEPGPGEVRVRVEGCGVCGSNLPVWEGQPWFTYPLPPGAPGHEGWGHVDAIGEDVRGVAAGDRIAMLSSHAFAEFDFARADQIVRLPAALDGRPCPLEAVGCAINVFRRSAITAGATVAIVGAGFIGVLLVQLAVRRGARVIALSRRAWARRLAAESGAHAVVSTEPPGDAARTVAAIAGANGCDCVIEAVGAQASLDLATALTREGGRLVIAGYHQDGPRTVDMQTWNWRGLDVINAHERDPRVALEAMRAGAAAAAAGEIDLTRLCTHAFPLDRVGEALDMLRARPDGFLKAVVTL